MAAGLGFKDFQTGEVLTAADVDGYLMQGIWVFASTAARDAAVTSPSEGNFAFTKDTNSLWYYDGAAWVASGATGDIEGVTAGIGISGGGTSGTVTVTNSMATAIDAKGDLVAGTGADTFAKLTVGANDTVLTADSTAATGLKWATPAASGSGLTFISSTTIGSAVSSVTVTGAFSSTYDNYLVTLQIDSASTSTSSAIQLGSTTTGYYGNAIYMDPTSSTVNGIGYNNTSSVFSGYHNATNGGASNIYILQPNLAKRTEILATGIGFNTSGSSSMNSTLFENSNTQHTAFTLILSSGTITGGKIRVYGYQNS